MAQSKGYKRFMAMAYGLGAAVVILGALFKLMHWPGASAMLIAGLGAEAVIFALSAFEPIKDDLDWSLVYPELAGSSEKKKAKKAPEAEEESLSKKLDGLLKEAKIDGELMNSLGTSIRNFEGAAKGIAPTVDSIAATKKYGEELSIAASQLESLNSLYKVQLDSVNRQTTINQETVENAQKLKEQMQSLASNLSSLNGVYGGMLTAMNR